MKNKKWFRRFNIIMCLIVLLSIPCAALADVMYPEPDRLPIDRNRRTSLALHFEHQGEAVEGIEYSIYKIATVTNYFKLELTEDFANYKVSLEGHDTNGWRALSTTLAAYAARDKIEPVAKDITDVLGYLRFGDLDTGIYLVVGKRFTVDQKTYIPEPFIVSLPYLNNDDSDWAYDLVAEPKYTTVVGELGETDISVKKVWDDNADTDRPETIVVQLLRDGDVYDEQELGSFNNWEYRWAGLDANYTWLMIEKEVPDGYTLLVELDGADFTVTNSSDRVTNTPVPTETPVPTNPTTTTPRPTATDEPVKIPQTGQLWWPVPLLVGVGVIIFIAGFIRWKKSENA